MPKGRNRNRSFTNRGGRRGFREVLNEAAYGRCACILLVGVRVAAVLKFHRVAVEVEPEVTLIATDVATIAHLRHNRPNSSIIAMRALATFYQSK